MKSRIVSIAAALVLAATAAGTAVAGGSQTGTSPVFTIGPGHTFIAYVPGGTSTLVRTSKGIAVSLDTSGLPAGHAVTVWALIFNNPSACGANGCQEMTGDLGIPEVQGSVFHVTGHVVDESDGFGGFVAVGDAAEAFVGPGLLDPYGAEIHLIVRDHGVAASGDLLQQQFNDISPRFCNVACADIQESIHLAHM